LGFLVTPIAIDPQNQHGPYEANGAEEHWWEEAAETAKNTCTVGYGHGSARLNGSVEERQQR
jgi:hypothetical protein